MESYVIMNFSSLKLMKRISLVFSFIVEKLYSFSINNYPRINVRKNRCSSNHTQLFFM